jgi:hypothetical protein
LTFGRAELLAFLRGVDAALTRPGGIRLIGGAAIGLRYAPALRTRDLDYAWADREVEAAIVEVVARRPKGLPAAQTGLYFAPYDHEERLEQLAVPGLKYLRVEIPERHDLAIMKIARGYDRDLEAVAQIHRAEALDLRTLVTRFDRTWITGPQRLADLAFLVAVETLFGGPAIATAERLLERLRRDR